MIDCLYPRNQKRSVPSETIVLFTVLLCANEFLDCILTNISEEGEPFPTETVKQDGTCMYTLHATVLSTSFVLDPSKIALS